MLSAGRWEHPWPDGASAAIWIVTLIVYLKPHVCCAGFAEPGPDYCLLCFRLYFLPWGFLMPVTAHPNCPPAAKGHGSAKGAPWQRMGVTLVYPQALSAASHQQGMRLLSLLLPQVRVWMGRDRTQHNVFTRRGCACQWLELPSGW